MVIKEIKDKVLTLIGNADTKEAINLLYKNRDKNDLSIVVLFNRWSELQKNRLKGVLSEPEYLLEMNRINNSILEYLSLINEEIKVAAFEAEYQNGTLLFTRNRAPLDISIEDAVFFAKRKIAFHGITLIGLFTGVITKLLINKIQDANFEELILLMPHPKNINPKTKVYSQMIYSLGESQIGELLKINSTYANKVKLFIVNEFIRYSAVYIDCNTSESGTIRVNFPMYGIQLEETPLAIIKQSTSLHLFQSFVKSAEILYERTGKPITNYAELSNLLISG